MPGFRDKSETGVTVNLGADQKVDVELELASVNEGDNGRRRNPRDRHDAGRDCLQRLDRNDRDASDRVTQPRRLRAARSQLRHDLDRAGRDRPLCGRTQQPLQQHPDRWRCEQRLVRHLRRERAGRRRRDAADQPRRHRRAAAGRVAVRRAAGQLHRGRHQRGHALREQPFPRNRLLLRPQRSAGRVDLGPRRRDSARSVQRPAGRVQPRRADRPEPRVLLRQFRSGPARHAFGILGRRHRVRPWGHQAEAQRFVDILRNRYNYDAGAGDDALGEFVRTTEQQ